MQRQIWAFIAFNIYSLVLISAFQENTPYLFDTRLVAEMRAAGDFPDLKEWGWKDHYLWRLFVSVVVTAIAGFLAGAIAREKGGKVVAIANIPSVIGWLAIAYMMFFSKAKVEGQTGFGIISLIATPLTVYIAYHMGKLGAEIQDGCSDRNTVLGIRSYHWAWAVFPIYWYGLAIIFVVTKSVALVRAVSIFDVFGGFISLLALVPVIAWVVPLVLVYQVLAGQMIAKKPPAVKAFANVGILVIGGVMASGLQVGCYLLLGKIMG